MPSRRTNSFFIRIHLGAFALGARGVDMIRLVLQGVLHDLVRLEPLIVKGGDVVMQLGLHGLFSCAGRVVEELVVLLSGARGEVGLSDLRCETGNHLSADLLPSHKGLAGSGDGVILKFTCLRRAGAC